MLSSQEIPTLNSQNMGWLAVRLLTLNCWQNIPITRFDLRPKIGQILGECNRLIVTYGSEPP